jgi:peptidoglycan/LPS O-acetylase OafA/YrhL
MNAVSGAAGAPPTRTSADFRPEIQALRAVAVTAVVLFHLWPDRLTGGFVGVDVFFAISGFLITGHLLREATSSSGIALPSFWARRIRRLMPAASTVLVATLVGTVVFLPQRLWQDAAQQIGASAIGLQNWLLASNSVDYFAADNQPMGAIFEHHNRQAGDAVIIGSHRIIVCSCGKYEESVTHFHLGKFGFFK